MKDRWRDWRFVRSGRWQSFWIQLIGRWFWCTHLKWQSEQIIMHIYVIFCDVSIIFHEHICNRWVKMFSQMCSGKFNISLHVLLWDLRKECFAEFRHLKNIYIYKKNIKTMHSCTIYLGPNTHGTRGHLTSCHRGPMAGHAHSSKNAFFKTTRHLKCWIPVRKSEGLAQPGVPLLVMLIEVQPKAQALKRFVVAARQLRK